MMNIIWKAKEFRVVLGNVKIQVFSYYPPVQAGEDAGVSFSPIFISPQYLINTSGENYRIGDKRHVIGIAIVALIFSALGMMPFLSAMAKWNTAIIGGFLIFMLFVNLLIG